MYIHSLGSKILMLQSIQIKMQSGLSDPYRLENYRTDRRENLYVGVFCFDKGSYDSLRPLPLLEERGPIQMKHQFLHNSRTNQASKTEFGMWMF